MKKVVCLVLATVLTSGIFTGCTASKKDDAKDVGGILKVVTGRTDADELFQQIEEKFKEKYPSVEDIVFESSADYDKYIQTRMNTTDYGDVLFVPFSMNGTPNEYENYFEPLGSVEELSKEYIDVTEADYNNNVYGLPAAINTLGIVYNEDVLKKAGVTKMPTSTEEFLEVCSLIKQNTNSIPFFTNFKRTAVWGGALTSYGGEQYRSEMLSKGTAFMEGQPIREILDLFYEVTKNGYTEKDPVTGDQGKAYQMLADGEIAMIMRGSQDVPTIQKLNTNSNIRIANFPVTIDGKTHAAVGSPAVVGINKNSENKVTAKAFLEFLISDESGYARSSNGIPPKKSELNDEDKKIIDTKNMVLTVPTEPLDVDVKYVKIANEVGVGRIGDAIQKTINIALYPDKNESYDEYINGLETAWQKAIKNNE